MILPPTPTASLDPTGMWFFCTSSISWTPPFRSLIIIFTEVHHDPECTQPNSHFLFHLLVIRNSSNNVDLIASWLSVSRRNLVATETPPFSGPSFERSRSRRCFKKCIETPFTSAIRRCSNIRDFAQMFHNLLNSHIEILGASMEASVSESFIN